MSQVVFLCALSLVHYAYGGTAKEVFSWKQVDFEWPSNEFKDNAIKSGSYIKENNLPLGLAVWKDKLFVTVPRWKAGVASSLNYVKLGSEKSAPLIPYPSWDLNYIPANQETVTEKSASSAIHHDAKRTQSHFTLKDNRTVISVFRVSVDKCDRLWVMDSGYADILGSPQVIASPSLIIFDLNTDTLVRRYFFKASDVKESSFMANVVVDVNPKDCDNAYAYVPDLGAYGVIVYSFKDDASWRVKHHYFHFDPLAGQYRVAGIDFQWTDGVFGLALSKANSDDSRKVFFHAFSSTKEFEVSNKILQNETWATSAHNFHDFKLVGERGPNTQASANFFDESTGVLFYTQVNRDGVACWNSAKPMSPETTALVINDAETLEFPNDLKVHEGVLWVLSDKLPKFVYQGLDPNVVNFRILTIDTKEAIKGTVCA